MNAVASVPPAAGAPWLLLRGLMRETAHWDDFPHRLSLQLGVPARTLDLPGNGHHHRLDSPVEVDTMVAHGRATLAAAGATGPHCLLALSLGGMVALRWAALYPQEVERLVLINTSVRPWCPLHWRLRPATWPTLLRLVGWTRDPIAIERAVQRLTSRRHADDPAVLARWLAVRQARPVRRINVLRQLLAAARCRVDAPADALPMLLLCGARDALVDPRCSHRLAGAWRAPLRVHPRAGHDLPLDDPEWVIGQVAGWLARPGVPAGAAAR